MLMVTESAFDHAETKPVSVAHRACAFTAKELAEDHVLEALVEEDQPE